MTLLNIWRYLQTSCHDALQRGDIDLASWYWNGWTTLGTTDAQMLAMIGAGLGMKATRSQYQVSDEGQFQ